MRVALLVASLLVSTPVVASASEPAVDAEKLSDTLYRLQMSDGDPGHVNALLSIGPDGLMLVDFVGNWQTMECDPAAAEVMDAKIRELGGERPMRYIINTHWHGDHIGGNEIYGKEAVIVAHSNTRKRLMEEQKPWWWPDGLRPLEDHGLPGVTFDNSLSLHFNGEEVRLLHFGEAHTDGDAVVHFVGSGVAHMGDLFHGMDLLAMADDVEGLGLTLAGVSSRLPRDTKLVTGHAGVSGMGELQRFQRMLMAATGHVRREIADGRSLEEIQAAGLPKPWDTEWKGDAAQVPRWLDMIHRSLGGASSGGH